MSKRANTRARLGAGFAAALASLVALIAVGNAQVAVTTAKASYVGSAGCIRCHASMVAAHAKGPHGGLIAPLPESMRGCESCHGPGSLHATGDKTAIINPAKVSVHESDASCLVCHGANAGPSAPPKAQKLVQLSWMRGRHPRKDVGCVACHSEHKGGEKQLKKAKSELCYSCHNRMVGQAGDFQHAAVQKGNCLDCHDAHASGRPSLVKSGVDATCRKCHDVAKPAMDKAHGGLVGATTRCVSCHSPHIKDKATHGLPSNAHKPYADRSCGQCHAAPTAAKTAPLKAPVTELCGKCHAAGKMDALSASHPPVRQKLCTTCHTPHASRLASPPLFKAKPDFVCLSCHKQVDTALQKKYQHAPVEAGNCTSCHYGHKSPVEKLLIKAPMDLCQGCHPDQRKFTHPVGVKDDNGRKVVIVDPRNKRQLTCASCHDVHGGPHEYISQADWRRDLCVQCHKGGMKDQ